MLSSSPARPDRKLDLFSVVSLFSHFFLCFPDSLFSLPLSSDVFPCFSIFSYFFLVSPLAFVVFYCFVFNFFLLFFLVFSCFPTLSVSLVFPGFPIPCGWLNFNYKPCCLALVFEVAGPVVTYSPVVGFDDVGLPMVIIIVLDFPAVDSIVVGFPFAGLLEVGGTGFPVVGFTVLVDPVLGITVVNGMDVGFPVPIGCVDGLVVGEAVTHFLSL